MEDKKRRKSKGGNDESCSSKKKKDRTPQRGLGVATLERLRIQENLKQITQTTNNLPFNLFMDSSSMSHHQQGLMMNSNNVVVPGVPFPPTFGSFEGIHNNNNNNINKVGVGHFCGDQEGLFVQRVGGFNGLFPGKNCVGFSGVGLGNGSNVNKNEASNELSSTPLSFWSLRDKCGLCHKKKRVDGNKVANQNQAVEVVAVHRKGGPCGGGVMMEYEFFPEKGGRNCSSSTSVVEELMRSGGVESSSSIDLTLKLC